MTDRAEPEVGRTFLKRRELYRDRWSSFGERTGLESLSEQPSIATLRGIALFDAYDDAFLERIGPDVSIGCWRPGAVLFEEGAYIDLAFFVVEGEVEVSLGAGGAADQPIFDLHRTGFFEVPRLASLARPPGGDEGLDDAGDTGSLPRGTVLAQRAAKPGEITFLAALDFDLPRGSRETLGPGELFGEIGAMSGWPQSVTARTASEATLVHLRMPALRAMRRKSEALKERLDAAYRRRSLAGQLDATPLFHGCPPVFLAAIREVVDLVSLEPGETLASEGEPVDGLFLVRSGFLQLTQRLDQGEITVNYLSKGMTLGEVELLVDDSRGWTASATSVEYAELVRLPRGELVQMLRQFPEVEKRLWRSAVDRIRETGFSRRDLAHAELLETAVDTGLVQGSAMLVIDLAACTRCDDCVRACERTHGGRARFIREGDKLANLQIASACYHCRDPVCLVGCPTGAIHRTGFGQVVAVDETICIGCGSCARACPYDAIVMHETGATWPDDMIPEGLRGKDRLVASKCDLCCTRVGGPACVESCPNGCAYRIGSLEEFEGLLRR